MYPIKHRGNVTRLIQERLEMLQCLLLIQVQPKLILNLLVHIAVLDVRNVGVDHKGDEVENEVRTLTEDGEGGETVVLEAQVVGGLGTAHAVDHFFADFDWGRERLRVAPENITKVDWARVELTMNEKVPDNTHHGRNARLEQ